jgi:hypothetical protein
LYLARATLTDETTWKLRFVLSNVPTEKGRKVDGMFLVDVKFIEEPGYEPPQGTLSQLLPESDDDGRTLRISKSRWLLSEDPNERKDGLWVWGLFKEPLYPFLLLTVETEAIDIPGEDGDSIKPLTMFAKISHKRDEAQGVILNGSELNVRNFETIAADPFGVSTANVYEEAQVGQLRIQAT